MMSTLLFCSSHGQIPIQNGSFEGGPGFQLIPVGWSDCTPNIGTATMPYSTWIGVALPSYDGDTYIGSDYHPHSASNRFIDSLNQRLDCPMSANKKHSFRIAIYTISEDNQIGQFGSGIIRVYGGNNKCSTNQLLWESPVTTNYWRSYTAEFVPDSNWQYITIMPWSKYDLDELIGIDALSDISVENYIFCQLVANVNATDSNCYSLKAITDMGNANLEWQSEPSISFTSDSIQEICITENTWITLNIKSACGEYTDSIYLPYRSRIQDLIFPNAFTPNNDGRNDYFLPINTNQQLQSYQLYIYNHWGQLLFESSDITKGWNGTYSDSLQPSGTYLYACTYETANGLVNSIKGSITLLR